MAYKIIVKEIDEDGNVTNEDMLDGMTAEGVAILAKLGEGEANASLLNLCIVDIAAIISSDENMLEAAMIGKAMFDARDAGRKLGANKFAESLGKMLGHDCR